MGRWVDTYPIRKQVTKFLLGSMGAKRQVDGSTIYLAQAAILSFHSIVSSFFGEAVRV